MSAPVDVRQIEGCCAGAVPAVLVTASADGTPNVTYLSRVHLVDQERVAISNQFMSKTARNIAERPDASLLLIDPATFDEYRLSIRYERTDRRGPVFEALVDEVSAIAALTGMQDVFRLRAADVYRVVALDRVPAVQAADGTGASPAGAVSARPKPAPTALAELCARIGRCGDLDLLVDVTVAGLDDLLGYRHAALLLVDEWGGRLFTLASRGHSPTGIGSEVAVGVGEAGLAAERCAPVRVGNLRQMRKYSTTVRRSFEAEGTVGPGHELPLPALTDADSRLAVPMLSQGQLVGVIVLDDGAGGAFTADDEATMVVVAAIAGSAIEAIRTSDRLAAVTFSDPSPRSGPSERVTEVRFFAVDGSTFLDGDYLIKGVAGRILWSLVSQYARDGRTDFTNREVRLDPALDLPASRDNLESRLILLKRRLAERDAPIRIEPTGRGRFRLDVSGVLKLDRTDG